MFNRKGFTITELVVAMVILSILLLFAVPNYNKYNMKKEILKMSADVEMIESAIISYTMSGSEEQESERFDKILGTDAQPDPDFYSKLNTSQRADVDEMYSDINNLKTIDSTELNQYIRKLNNDFSDYVVSSGGTNKGLVFHKNGFFIGSQYYNGVQKY